MSDETKESVAEIVSGPATTNFTARRHPCSITGCKVPVGFFPIKGGLLCGFCLDRFRRDAGLSLDEIRDTDLAIAIATLKPAHQERKK